MTPIPDFLSVEEVEFIHGEQLSRYGGTDGLRDRDLLESAVATPQAMFEGEFLHQGLFAMAAAYAFHVAENQPFVDGNKRTGLVSALVFLELNEVTVLDPDGRLYQAMIDIAKHEGDKKSLAALLRELAL